MGSPRRKIFIASIALMIGAAAGAMQATLSLGTGKAAPAIASASTTPTRFPVTVNTPSGPPVVDTGLVDADGNAVTASCTTCHAARPANPANVSPDDLDEFHQGLTFAHGSLACLSCHNPTNYDTLRLADGSGVKFARVMDLCAQCHWSQARDFTNGAHGGMTGYWDLTRGPRFRNGCTDCHDPHAPAFPRMMPTFKPRDRFLTPGAGDREFDHE